MSRTTVRFVTSLVVALGLVPAQAQTPGSMQTPDVGNTVLVAQYECNPADHAKVDRILKDVAAPILNRKVAEGKLLTWGVLATSVGGPATRTIYVWAKDAVGLMKARAEYLPEIMAQPEWSEVARACPTQVVSISTMMLRAQPPAK
jgi:hypothetical protein